MMPVSTVDKQDFKKLITVMAAKYTLPNISPSAVHRVEGKGGAAAQRWFVVWWYVQTTSDLTEQEANEAELNN